MPDAPRPAGFSLEDAVLDIGGDIGALILYTDADDDGREIEVSPIDEAGPGQGHEHGHRHNHPGEQEPGHGHWHDGGGAHRTHTAIHERRAGGLVTYAGIYPELRAGTYRIWTDDPTLPDRVTIVGGEVAEVDWRRNRGSR
jgi:hypothetical protein